MDIETFQHNLLQFYDSHKRDLPWRKNPDPYHILLSEFLLQQTRMEAALPYFHRFVEVAPTIQDLKNLPEEKLLKLWEGLGYYRRAMNLKKSAIMICEDFGGKVPDNVADLLKLPGVGEYTAGAIASTAYQVKAPAMDGNVIRILARYFLIEDDPNKSQGKKAFQAILLDLLPDKRTGDFNQALMELGALICLPNGVPLCEQCPIQEGCIAFQENRFDLPVKKQKKPLNIIKKTHFIIRSKSSVILQQRPETGLLANMWEYPHIDEHLSIKEVQEKFPHSKVIFLGKHKHVFSHMVWDQVGFLVEMENDGILLEEADLLPMANALKVYREKEKKMRASS